MSVIYDTKQNKTEKFTSIPVSRNESCLSLYGANLFLCICQPANISSIVSSSLDDCSIQTKDAQSQLGRAPASHVSASQLQILPLNFYTINTSQVKTLGLWPTQWRKGLLGLLFVLSETFRFADEPSGPVHKPRVLVCSARSLERHGRLTSHWLWRMFLSLLCLFSGPQSTAVRHGSYWI